MLCLIHHCIFIHLLNTSGWQTIKIKKNMGFVEIMSISLSASLWPSTNDWTSVGFSWNAMLGTGVLYNKLSNKRECREIWLLYSTDKWKIFCLNFPISWPIRVKFGTSCLHLTLLSNFELWKASMNLRPYCTHLLSELGEIRPKRFSYLVDMHLSISWNSAQGMSYFL